MDCLQQDFFFNYGVKECMHIPTFQQSLIFLFLYLMVLWFFFELFTGSLAYPLSKGFSDCLPKVYPCVLLVNYTSVWSQDLLSVPYWSDHDSACSECDRMFSCQLSLDRPYRGTYAIKVHSVPSYVCCLFYFLSYPRLFLLVKVFVAVNRVKTLELTM